MKKADLNDTDEELDLDFSDDEEYVIKDADSSTENDTDDDNIVLENEDTYDEADEAFDRAEKKRAKGSLIRNVILVMAVIVFCYSAYMLTNIFLEYKKGTDTYKEIDNTVINEDSTISVDFGEQEVEIPLHTTMKRLHQ